MASGMTQFCANLLLERLLRGTAGSFPATLWVGLFSVTPTDTYTSGSPTGTELTAGVLVGYARKPTAGLTVAAGASFAALAAGATTNSILVDYGTAGAGSVTVTQWGLFDALTAGNLYLWADLSPSQLVASGNPYSIAIGALGAGII